MKQLKDQLVKVSYIDMELQLLKQVKKIEKATDSEKRTLELALHVAREYKETKSFEDKDLAEYVVKLYLPNEDKHTQQAIAKMLYEQYSKRFNELNLSKEFRRLREGSKRKCKSYKDGLLRTSKLG